MLSQPLHLPKGTRSDDTLLHIPFPIFLQAGKTKNADGAGAGILLAVKASSERNVHLLPTEDQPLLHRWDALLLFDSLLDLADFVVWFDVQLDFLACECAHSIEARKRMSVINSRRYL